MFLFLNLTHQSHAVLEADLVSSPYLISGSLTLQIAELVKQDGLFLSQRLLKRNSGLFPLIGEMIGLDSSNSAIVNLINHCKHPFGNYLACCTCLTMFS